MQHFIELGQYGFNDPEKLINSAFELKKKKFSTNNRLSLNIGRSSISKGESIEDTLRTLELMTGTYEFILTRFYEDSTRTILSFQKAIKLLGYNHVDVITTPYPSKLSPIAMVIRHSESTEDIFQYAKKDVPVINAGSGTESHPTQALTDMITIQEHFGRIKGLKVAIFGDIEYSRVAKSLMKWLDHFGAIVGDMKGADIAYILRPQTERRIIFEMPQFTEKDLKLLNKDGVIMHAGPVTGELSWSMSRSERSLIDQQVKNSVFAKMAVLEYAISPTCAS